MSDMPNHEPPRFVVKNPEWDEWAAKPRVPEDREPEKYFEFNDSAEAGKRMQDLAKQFPGRFVDGYSHVGCVRHRVEDTH